ncbi:MAG TPA: lysophospholipid acyltransferase family protein [Steroidobacteraceae bacterium]|nr:lysophospholipid acyltransferase family protein [Steroidobacteraceae bacterium]
MLKSISYCWRLLATALCFAVFGLLGLVSGLVVFPLMRLVPGRLATHRRRVRAVFRMGMRFFLEFMRAVGVLTYEFHDTSRLGRPGQMILANHPSLIDVVFLLAFTPQPLCIVKAAMWRNPFTRWPVMAAGFVSNESTFEMVERTAAALAEGQSVIIFPEGTRTTPGQALQFHRGAANIAVKAARIVTPVFIRCDPTTLAKNMPWYRIPPRRVRFTLRVGTDIEMDEFRTAPPPKASRALNEHLLRVFAEELRSGGRPAQEPCSRRGLSFS